MIARTVHNDALTARVRRPVLSEFSFLKMQKRHRCESDNDRYNDTPDHSGNQICSKPREESKENSERYARQKSPPVVFIFTIMYEPRSGRVVHPIVQVI